MADYGLLDQAHTVYKTEVPPQTLEVRHDKGDGLVEVYLGETKVMTYEKGAYVPPCHQRGGSMPDNTLRQMAEILLPTILPNLPKDTIVCMGKENIEVPKPRK